MIDILSNIEFGLGSWQRAWTYQTCSEFGWYQTSDQPEHPYGSRFPIEDYIKVCRISIQIRGTYKTKSKKCS